MTGFDPAGITADIPRATMSYPVVQAEPGLALLHRGTGLRGRLERLAGAVVEIVAPRGRRHQFRNRPGAFAVHGETVTLVPADPSSTSMTQRSAAGALVQRDASPRVARASRLWVEGDHDARLLERVWGDDLRELGIVVEALGGVDHLEAALTDFSPGPARSVVVLVDHLVEGSKEHRMAVQVRSSYVHVVGHPHVDIWECVRASSVGIAAWPSVPRGEDWKSGVCARLGWESPQEGWRRVLASVDSFADLEPCLVQAGEQALDLLCEEAADR